MLAVERRKAESETHRHSPGRRLRRGAAGAVVIRKSLQTIAGAVAAAAVIRLQTLAGHLPPGREIVVEPRITVRMQEAAEAVLVRLEQMLACQREETAVSELHRVFLVRQRPWLAAAAGRQ